MAELNEVNLSEMFNAPFESAGERLEQSYRDSVVRERFAEMIHASDDELPCLQAQLDTYLAAAYYLFPEESKIIHESLKRIKSYGEA